MQITIEELYSWKTIYATLSIACSMVEIAKEEKKQTELLQKLVEDKK